jgi:hypothetical protein
MFSLRGRSVAAAYQLSQKDIGKGVPPHWSLYFAADNTDKTVMRAKSLGAAVIMDPTDVTDVGRMAVLGDPSGAVFNLWQARRHKGFEVTNEVNALLWSELATRDLTGSRDFYTKLFGWEAQGHPSSPEGYLVCSKGGVSFGGIMQMTEEWGDTPAHWSCYFWVEECDQGVARTKELGGSVCIDPWDIQGVGRIAACSDPQGARFYLLKPQPM